MFKLTKRQTEAYQALDDPTVVDVLYGGAKGGGKSFFLCVWVFQLAVHIANTFNLQPTPKPIHAGWMGRKQATDFTSTTLQTWQDVIPDDNYQIKAGTEKHPKHILIQGRIAVDFGGLDRREDINKFNSAEYGFMAIDQAEETAKDDVAVLQGSRRLKIHGHPLYYKGLYTANPANCWLKDDFIPDSAPYRRFVQALPSDNPHLPDSYIDMLKDSFGHRPELLEAYLYGSWDLADDVDQVLKAIWLEQAGGFTQIKFQPQTRKYITCDVARYGDNETVNYYMHDTDIVDEVIYGQRGIDYTVNRLTAWSNQHNQCPVIVDEGGVGGGVVDVLASNGINVIAANSATRPDQTNPMYTYGNKRAEVWDYAARTLSRGEVELHHKDPMLRKQLCTPKYKYSNGRIYIESKEEITKRLGRGQSPDRADAYVNGLYYGRNVTPTDAEGIIQSTAGAMDMVPDDIMLGIGV